MSTRATFHHLDAIGAGVGSLFGSLMIDALAARRQDALMRERIARRARIRAKLARLEVLRSARAGRLA